MAKLLQYQALVEPLLVTAATSGTFVASQSVDPISTQQFQYESEVSPVQVTATPETITLDKWNRPGIQPRAKGPSLVGMMGSFVPLVSPPVTAVYIQVPTIDPFVTKSFQYEDLVKPLLPITPSSEAITLDKWFRLIQQPQPRPIRRLGETAFLSLSTSRTEQVFVNASNPEPIWIKYFQYEGEVKPLVVTVTPEGPITLDKWLAQWPQPYFRPKRLIQYGVNTAIAGQADDGLPPVWWLLPINQPLNKKASMRGNGYASLNPSPIAGSPEAITLDKWFRLIHQPLPRPVRRFGETAFLSLATSRTEQVFVSSISPEPIRIISFQYDGDMEPIRFTTTPEGPVTLDKWKAAWPDPYFRRKRLIQYGTNTAIAGQSDNGLPPVRWLLELQQPQRQLIRKRPESGVFRFTPTPTETLTLDKWNPAPNQPRFSRASYRFMDAQPLARTLFGETTTLDKWFNRIEQPRFSRAPFRYTDYGSRPISFVTTPEGAITLDKWFQPLSLPTRRRVALQPQGGVRPEPVVTNGLPPVRWMLAIEQPIRRQPLLQPQLPTELLRTLTPATIPYEWNVASLQPERRKAVSLAAILTYGLPPIIIVPPVSGVRFRRTLSLFGTRAGQRQEEE